MVAEFQGNTLYERVKSVNTIYVKCAKWFSTNLICISVELLPCQRGLKLGRPLWRQFLHLLSPWHHSIPTVTDAAVKLMTHTSIHACIRSEDIYTVKQECIGCMAQIILMVVSMHNDTIIIIYNHWMIYWRLLVDPYVYSYNQLDLVLHSTSSTNCNPY